ncbi:MAG: hypothetical protein L0H04_06165, partial [Pseudomonas sp.]|nr:hypothetical protein [Pseudomonas sp.]MDN5530806.1 hypothetical protein [Pseudomonas sp.]
FQSAEQPLLGQFSVSGNMISSEMPELLGTCDRIYVMNEGRFVGEFPIKEASQERIMHAIMKNEVIQ